MASFSTPCHVLQVNWACVWSWSYSNPGKKNMWWRNFILTILPAIFKSCYLRIAPIPHEALAGAQHFPKYLSTGQSWFENTAFFSQRNPILPTKMPPREKGQSRDSNTIWAAPYYEICSACITFLYIAAGSWNNDNKKIQIKEGKRETRAKKKYILADFSIHWCRCFGHENYSRKYPMRWSLFSFLHDIRPLSIPVSTRIS